MQELAAAAEAERCGAGLLALDILFQRQGGAVLAEWEKVVEEEVGMSAALLSGGTGIQRWRKPATDREAKRTAMFDRIVAAYPANTTWETGEEVEFGKPKWCVSVESSDVGRLGC
jgi:hypothetical protein